MPDKTPHIWLAIWEAVPEVMRSAIIGTSLALLRTMYDDKEPRMVRRILESLICGVIAYTVSVGMHAVGWREPGLATFAGGMIGLLGADWVRTKARAFANSKIKKEEQ